MGQRGIVLQRGGKGLNHIVFNIVKLGHVCCLLGGSNGGIVTTIYVRHPACCTSPWCGSILNISVRVVLIIIAIRISNSPGIHAVRQLGFSQIQKLIKCIWCIKSAVISKAYILVIGHLKYNGSPRAGCYILNNTIIVCPECCNQLKPF